MQEVEQRRERLSRDRERVIKHGASFYAPPLPYPSPTRGEGFAAGLVYEN